MDKSTRPVGIAIRSSELPSVSEGGQPLHLVAGPNGDEGVTGANYRFRMRVEIDLSVRRFEGQNLGAAQMADVGVAQ